MDTSGAQLDDESLTIFFCEAEAIVNSRPLTVDSVNDPGSLRALIPHHLLTMKSNMVLPPPGGFNRQISIPLSVGVEYNIYPMSSGRDGERNFCMVYSNAKNGETKNVIVNLAISLLLRTQTFHTIAGGWDKYPKKFLGEYWYVRTQRRCGDYTAMHRANAWLITNYQFVGCSFIVRLAFVWVTTRVQKA